MRLNQEAHLHHEVFATALKGFVGRTAPSVRAYAQRRGVSHETVYRLLRPYTEAVRDLDRPVDPEELRLVRHLLAGLACSETEQQHLFEHYRAAVDARHRTRRAIAREIDAGALAQYVWGVRRKREEATFARVPQESRHCYEEAISLAGLVLLHLDLGGHPAALLEVALVANDVQSVRDRVVDALYKAGIALEAARRVLAQKDPPDEARAVEGYHNALRGRAIALRRLGLYREAWDTLEGYLRREEQECAGDRGLRRVRAYSAQFAGLLAQDKLKALVELPRFGVRLAERLYATAREQMPVYLDDYRPRMWLLECDLGTAYFKAGRHRKAAERFEAAYEGITRSREAGALHLVLVRQRYAAYLWAQGWQADPLYRQLVHEATDLAVASGLANEARKLRELAAGTAP